MAELRGCPVCGGSLRSPFEKNGYRIGRCSGCDVLAVMEDVTEHELTAFYNTQKTTDYRRRYQRISQRQRAKWHRRLSLIQALRGQQPPGSMLDVGCSFGAFLAIAQAAGWQTYGIEIMEEGRAACREKLGHERVFADLSALSEPAVFDVVCLWDIIEHLREPNDCLVRLYDLLRPAGLLALGTVNTGAWNRRWFGARWVFFSPPAHLVYFNLQSMKRALERVGFEQVFRTTRFLPHVFWQSLRGDAAVRAAAWPVRAAQRLAVVPIGVAARWFGAGDNMLVVARKPCAAAT